MIKSVSEGIMLLEYLRTKGIDSRFSIYNIKSRLTPYQLCLYFRNVDDYNASKRKKYSVLIDSNSNIEFKLFFEECLENGFVTEERTYKNDFTNDEAIKYNNSNRSNIEKIDDKLSCVYIKQTSLLKCFILLEKVLQKVAPEILNSER